MDYETLANCFVGVFKNYKTNKVKVFAICHLRNDFEKFIKFLETNVKNKEIHISYNGLAFDGQISEHIYRNRAELAKLSPKERAIWIYTKAQRTIELSRNREFHDYYENSMSFKHIDLFKLNHWDNAAKRSSLKWLQFMMDWKNLQDMPIEHSFLVTKQEELNQIINYCINDVMSTAKIFELSKKQIQLRLDLTKEYKVNLHSASETKISKELFLSILSEKTKISKYILKNSRTKRNIIIVKDIILPYISFKTKPFNELLNKFAGLSIDPKNIKGAFKATLSVSGVKTHFGLGGVHGAGKPGIYNKNEEMIIMSSDVVSFYPNLAIKNGWGPAHFPKKEFLELYEGLFEGRKKIPKSDPRNYVYKILLNATYGLSNSEYSFFYDPQFTMQITINGQLSLMMLYEMILTEIPGSIPLLQNTDGLETIIPKEYEDKYLNLCKKWEEITSLSLEHDKYQKLIIADVNSYIAVKEYTKIEKNVYETMKNESPHFIFKEENDEYYYTKAKCKGRFEWESISQYNVSTLHKNKSHLVVAKALYYYFLHNINPEKYISSNTNIFDYCIGKRIKGATHFVKTCHFDGNVTEEKQQKTIRYYISNKGCKLVKHHNSDGRSWQLEAGKWMQTVFNKYEDKEWAMYDVNEKYYIDLVYKEIEKITRENALKQLTLF
jgi:hypothetical protein